MKIRNACKFVELYARPDNIILANSPELLFIQRLCSNKVNDALSLFHEKKLFGDTPPVVDVPYGRYTGLGEIRKFTEGWLDRFNATSASVTPVIQTRGGGRSVTELVIDFVVDGEIEQVPMFVVGDLRTAGDLDEVRMYCNASYIPGFAPYRKPIFQPAHLEAGDPLLLTGAMREYYIGLHTMPHADIERVLGSLSKDCVFGGYRPQAPGEEDEFSITPEQVRKKFERICSYMPDCLGIRFETIIDDGKTCIIEWVHIISERGVIELSRTAQSGIAAYERNAEGLLCSIRICDYARMESQVDWSQTPVGTREAAEQINRVKEFPYTVGAKPVK